MWNTRIPYGTLDIPVHKVFALPATSARPDNFGGSPPLSLKSAELSDPTSQSKPIRLIPALALLMSAVVFGIAVFIRPGGEGPPGPDSPQGETVVDKQSSQAAAADPEWKSEEFAEAAETQLKELATLLETPALLTPERLQKIVSVDIQSSSLRPEKRSVRFQTETLTVRTGIPDTDSAVKGIAAFGEVLRTMSAPLIESTDVHSKVKIISVDQRSPTEILTDVIVQRAGSQPNGSLQQDAVWRCVWSRPSDESDELSLIQVSLTAYEEAQISSSAVYMFSDCTQSVFRDEPSYETQLMPGIDYWRSLAQKQHGVFPFGHHGIAVGD
ncbi:MAG: hypothetical protein GY758_05360, partial [Fuerstiella sp.]|nr:hypothetical protein [Fuerstiella sp.]